MFLGLYTSVQTFWAGLRERIAGESGAVATEYALLLVLIAIAIAATAGFLGQAIIQKFTDACTELGGATCS
jgi:Flp pilus assembly pilin Flp